MTEALIKDSLIRLGTATQARETCVIAGDNTATQAEQIARELDTLDSLLAANARSLHPQLVHFLANRSYAKALTFLGGDNGEIPASARRKINEENT